MTEVPTKFSHLSESKWSQALAASIDGQSLNEHRSTSPETPLARLWIHLGVDEGVDFCADIAVRLADVGAD
jgi:hypothetical protein